MEKKISAKATKALLKIAVENCVTVGDRGDLNRRYSDSEDFLDIAVWELQDMLEKAYLLGKEGK